LGIDDVFGEISDRRQISLTNAESLILLALITCTKNRKDSLRQGKVCGFSYR
jgi:hypothetical protein